MNNKHLNILLINDTSLNRHFGCHYLMNEMNRLFKVNNFKVKKRIFNDEINILNEVRKTKFKEIDFVIINGEGTLHGQQNHKVNEILKSAKFCSEELGKKVFLINSTIADLNKDQLSYFKYFERIYVREPSSFDFLKSEKIKSKVVPDILIGLELNLKSSLGYNEIVFTDSSIRKLDHKFDEEHKVKIISIKYYNHLEYYLLKFFIKFKFLKFLYNYLQYTKEKKAHIFLENLINSKLVVTGRFHAMIICFILKIPFVAYKSVSKKIEGVLKDAGLENRFRDIAKLKIYKHESLELSNEELKKIYIYKSQALIKIQSMFEDIKKITK